jgi:IS30 family transposase
MDFITGLPPSGARRVDAIFTIVCRKSKMCIFIPCHTTLSAETAAHLFFTMVVAIHGLPRSIVSDRDTRFTSRFWTSLFARMGTKLRPTSSFHPQGNGQAEHINKMVEGFLRA